MRLVVTQIWVTVAWQGSYRLEKNDLTGNWIGQTTFIFPSPNNFIWSCKTRKQNRATVQSEAHGALRTAKTLNLKPLPVRYA